MKLQYITALKKQYLSANGIAAFGTSKEEDKYFIEWFKERNVCKELYRNYLLLNGIDYNNRKNVEIGKGILDSISSEYGESVLLTKYAKTFDKKFDETIISGTLFVGNSVSAVIEDIKTRSHTHIFLDKMNLFYTQNVYFEDELEQFAKIHNIGKSILVGAYGKIYDKDRIAKIEQLRNLKKQLMDNNYKESYICNGDNYSYFIYTDPKRYKKYKKKNDYVMIKER